MRPLGFFCYALAVLAFRPAHAQRLELVGTVDFPNTVIKSGGSDVWGYTAPDGTEYALMGVREGIAVVQVPSLDVITTVPGPSEENIYYNRTVRAHGRYAYAVSECVGVNEGLMVIDLSGLPGSVELVNVHTEGVVSSHNMDVDEHTGYLYVLDSHMNGLWIIDAADPLHLVNVHWLDLPDIHDAQARNDTLYVAEGGNHTFSIWDVSDKTSPALLARVAIPNSGYVHSVWPTDDGRHVLTTEETADKTVKVWDISDLSDVELVGEYLGPSRLAHDVRVQGDRAFVSHYESGVVVLDVSDPTSPVEVDRYDTFPQGEGPVFNGTWGVTPRSPDDYVYGSDLDGELTVFRWAETAVAPTIGPLRAGPLVVPPEGGTYGYAVSLTNTTAQTQTAEAWVSARLPNGAPYLRVEGPTRRVLLPGETRGPITRRVTIPPYAPEGVYTVTLNVGTYPSTVTASDTFTFVKAEGVAGEGVPGEGGSPALLPGGAPLFAEEALHHAATAPTGLEVSPNPSRGRSTARFTLDAPATVRLRVLDALGREVATLAEGEYAAGPHAVSFEQAGLPAGLYLVRLDVAGPARGIGGRVETRRLTLLR